MWGRSSRDSSLTWRNRVSSFWRLTSSRENFPFIQTSRGRDSMRWNFRLNGLTEEENFCICFIIFFGSSYHGGMSVRWRFFGWINRIANFAFCFCHLAIEALRSSDIPIATNIRCFMPHSIALCYNSFMNLKIGTINGKTNIYNSTSASTHPIQEKKELLSREMC